MTPWLMQIDPDIVKAERASEQTANICAVVQTQDSESSGMQTSKDSPISLEQDGEPAGGSSSTDVHQSALPGGSCSSDADPVVSEPVPAEANNTVNDLLAGLSDDVSWQHKKYSSDNAIWQGAALRRRMHPRRTNKSLGKCSVDPSGPHDPTPRPGLGVKTNPCQ